MQENTSKMIYTCFQYQAYRLLFIFCCQKFRVNFSISTIHQIQNQIFSFEIILSSSHEDITHPMVSKYLQKSVYINLCIWCGIQFTKKRYTTVTAV